MKYTTKEHIQITTNVMVTIGSCSIPLTFRNTAAEEISEFLILSALVDYTHSIVLRPSGAAVDLFELASPRSGCVHRYLSCPAGLFPLPLLNAIAYDGEDKNTICRVLSVLTAADPDLSPTGRLR